MKKKRRSALAVTLPDRQVQTKRAGHEGGTPLLARVGRYRRVGLVRLEFLFLLQPRRLSSRPVAIGRVVSPRVVLARFSSPLEPPPPALSQDVAARHRERGFRNSGQGTAENSSRLPRLATPSHTGAVKSPMTDREPVSVCTSQPSWNFVWQRLWSKSMAPRRFFGRCSKCDSLLRLKFETSREMGWLRHARLLPVSCLSIV